MCEALLNRSKAETKTYAITRGKPYVGWLASLTVPHQTHMQLAVTFRQSARQGRSLIRVANLPPGFPLFNRLQAGEDAGLTPAEGVCKV